MFAPNLLQFDDLQCLQNKRLGMFESNTSSSLLSKTVYLKVEHAWLIDATKGIELG